VHSHHPFLLGDTALRVAAARDVPVVFTYHTRYEHYSHYASADSSRLKRLILEIALQYCDLCDAIIAPSESLAEILELHNITAPISVIPTGVRLEQFASGDRNNARVQLKIPADAFVLGHVGRLATEKNLAFLAEAMSQYLRHNDCAHCLIAGEGSMKEHIQNVFEKHGLGKRLHLVGVIDREALADVYSAMDVFAFSSYSETQGLVLAEAMASGIPVVALDAPGVREIVRDGVNGRLLAAQDTDKFVEALAWSADLDTQARADVQQAARETADQYSLTRTVGRAAELYRSVIAAQPSIKNIDESEWDATRRVLKEDWKILGSIAQALNTAVLLPADNEK
jgi:glycosyltransferase involved in cell wall biosynthesis